MGGDVSSSEGDVSIDTIISDLDSTHQDILSELQDISSKPLQIVGNKINRAIDLLNGALQASDENGDLDKCNRKLLSANKILNKAIDQLESRECDSPDSNPRRCIPQDIVETYDPDLQDSAASLDEAISIDDDGDGIPDVCGLSDTVDTSDTSDSGDK